MRILTRSLVAALLLLCASWRANATHIYGVDIQYEHVSGLTYDVIFTVYGDCEAANYSLLPGASPTIEIYNNSSFYTNLVLSNTGPNGEVTPVCPDEIDNTACSNPFSTNPGVGRFIYTGQITLPYNSTNWRFRFDGDITPSVAGRSNSITNITTGSIMAVEASLNSTLGNNNSPTLTALPTPFFCINVPASYNPGAVDPDGNDLTFSLVPGMTQGGGLVNYIAPYTATNPLETATGAFAFSTATGQIDFTPDAVQRSLVVERVEEYNEDGELVGTCMREMTFVVQSNCDNNPPGGVISNPSTGTVDTSATTLQVCSSLDTLTFSLIPTDDDGDSITITSAGLPAGSTLIVSNNGTTNPIGVFIWELGPVADGTYTFYVTYTDNGCPLASVQTKAYTIIIGGQQVHTINDTTICYGVSLNMTTTGDPDAAYTWSPPTGLNNPNIASPVATPLVTTTYVVSALSSGLGCEAETDTVTITVQMPATVSAGPDITTCLGTPVQLNSTANPPQLYTYSWYPGGPEFSDPTIPNPLYNPSAVGTFSLIVSADPGVGGSCAGSDTVNVRVLPDDFNLYNNDTTICLGASVQINADGVPEFAYLWAPTTGVSNPVQIDPIITPADTGSYSYTVTASYPTCPDIVKDITIKVEPSPSVTVGPDLVKCQWDTLQLHALISPAGYEYYTYFWGPDSNLIALVTDGPSGLNPNATTDVVFSGQDTATIRFTVQTPAGCAATDSLDIIVYPGNFASIIPDRDAGVCPGDSVQLQVLGGVMYDWTPGTYLNDSTAAAPMAYPVNDVRYTAIVTDQYGCLDTLDIDVDVRPAALLSLPDTVVLYPGDSLLVDPGGNCLYYQWFPYGGLTSPAIANPVLMPAVDTRYYVVGTTEHGCVARDSVEVIVNEDSELDVPNAFVPGGENKNIKPVHLGLASVKYFRIYNRWGTLVFSTSDINEGWDGTHNGTPQPMGVYIYQVEGQTFKGRTVKKSGNITLVR